MSNIVWKNIRYINLFNKYKNIILFEKIIWYHICRLVCLICAPAPHFRHSSDSNSQIPYVR